MLPALRFSLCVTFAVSGIALAQNLPNVKQDTTFPVELRHTIHVDSAKVGDPVEFRTVESVLIGSGIVVPSNALLLGEVEEVQPKSLASQASSLSIRIHTLRWDKNEIPLNAVVASLFFTRASYLNLSPGTPKSTFLEDIQIIAHLSDRAFTEFSSRKKNFALRNGVLVLLRQVGPGKYGNSLAPSGLASTR